LGFPQVELLAEGDFILLRKPASAESLLETLRGAISQISSANRKAGPDAAQTAASTVAIVDDDKSVRDALGSLLLAEGFLVETYANGESFLKVLRPDAYGCALIDIGLPGMDGLSLLSGSARRAPKLPLIIITGRRDTALAVQAMRGGAVDFLEKPVSSDALLASVRAALARLRDATEADAVFTKPLGRFGALTAREREIMGLVTKGMATKEIARDLSLSPRTVEKHRARIMYKMGTDRLADLVRMAVQIEADRR
jgi:FixJ family two-component response regulator